ncbi:hypothetical protein BaRGS_00010442 [Batillaria attramentaria]|uniref:Uncharacterized protein n=1 Tax=Batillaria attramentaria TaxID=370345 RepID=A0ABD0LFD3_9CAEN
MNGNVLKGLPELRSESNARRCKNKYSVRIALFTSKAPEGLLGFFHNLPRTAEGLCFPRSACGNLISQDFLSPFHPTVVHCWHRGNLFSLLSVSFLKSDNGRENFSPRQHAKLSTQKDGYWRRRVDTKTGLERTMAEGRKLARKSDIDIRETV